ncbi:hypothetical protein ABFA25_02605 [Mycobacterium lepromatosis]|nr:hypothetical protein [Mycobacterium lepromatosis]
MPVFLTVHKLGPTLLTSCIMVLKPTTEIPF